MARSTIRDPDETASSASGMEDADEFPPLTASARDLHDHALNDPLGRTGRMIAVFRDRRDLGISRMMRALFDVTEAHSDDFREAAFDFSELQGADMITFGNLGMAVLGGPAAKAARTQLALEEAGTVDVAADPPFVLVPETIEWAQVDTASYLRGFRAAIDRIEADLFADGRPGPDPGRVEQGRAAPEALTWGLAATRVGSSPATGRHIGVAILDTGLDLGHPDFAGRRILAQSFIPGETPQDGNGHGTHVAGTACGPMLPTSHGGRYGIAHECDILVGKVLGDNASGPTAGILAGINWALQNEAVLINLSLGNRNPAAALHYTQAGQRALEQGALIVAAAGNFDEPAGQPANSPTILSVSSVTPEWRKSIFSNHGKVELAAPGCSIDSALPRPRLRGFLSGTSMAAPHVTGIAALHAQAQGLRGRALWQHLEATARRLALRPENMGAGLVQA